MDLNKLKQEAQEYAEGMAKYYASTHEDCIPSQFEKYLRNAYISSAEPREKEIKSLGKRCLQLQKDKGNLTDRVRELEQQIEQAKKDKVVEHFESYGQCRDSRRIAELEAQIEKMKCCGNCKHQYEGQYHNGFKCKDHYKEEVCESYEWELAE